MTSQPRPIIEPAYRVRISVPMELAMSPEPTPLDVFFLLDTSGSMDDVVRGLAVGFGETIRVVEVADERPGPAKAFSHDRIVLDHPRVHVGHAFVEGSIAESHG